MKELKSYLVSCGDGLMNLVIFPDETTMLFDCNVRKDDEERILSFLSDVLPKNKIDIFVNSHRDEDHIRGIKIINEKFPIENIWDSGQSGSSTDGDSYREYMAIKRLIKNNNPSKVKELKPSRTPIIQKIDYSIYCLNSKDNIDGTENDDSTDGKIQHTNCLVLLVECYGKKILLTGDSDWKAWKKITSHSKYNDDYLKGIDLLIASHHGSRTFFTSEENDCINVDKNKDTTFIDSIIHINPTITLISCEKDSRFKFPNEEALELYKKYTDNSQVYTTAEFGTFTCLIDEKGVLTVDPYSFREASTSKSDIYYSLVCNINGESKQSEYDGFENDDLTFEIKTNMHDGYKKIESIEWVVSNNGVGKDKKHQEIYSHNTGNYRFYNRKLVYSGTHKLQAKIKLKVLDKYIYKTFIVRG